MTEQQPTAQSSVEIEVPGTPEVVWEAIATGAGLTAWFVPAEVDGREGGTVTTYHGVGEELASREVIRVWAPPTRYTVSSAEPAGAEGVTLATEFLVEAREGGTCVVRIVASGFGDKDWEQELASYEKGWGLYLRNLRVYLTHFAGQRCSPVLITGNSTMPQAEAWAAFARELGLDGAAERDRVSTPPGTPTLVGFVETVAEDTIILRLDEPAPGTAIVTAFAWDGSVYTSMHAYFYGDQASEVAAGEQAAWRVWMEEHFPSAEVPSAAATVS